MTDSGIIVAFDDIKRETATDLAQSLWDRAYAFKVHELIDQYGPSIIRELKRFGAQRVWADMKLHDVHKTVGLRAKALAEAGADIISVHASGGVKMMKAALANAGKAKIYAVTLLTSLDPDEVEESYDVDDPKILVRRWALLAAKAGVHGIVCSPEEVAMLAAMPEIRDAGIELITPGIRPAGSDLGGQSRIATPAVAKKAGATYLVVGSPITQDQNPIAAFDAIAEELQTVAA